VCRWGFCTVCGRFYVKLRVWIWWETAFLIVVYVLFLLVYVLLFVVYVLDAATLNEVFPCFFLSCKANARA
jgi:hypothetical protein